MSGSFRPRSLFEVSRRAAGGEQAFDPALREFLDVFYGEPAARGGACRGSGSSGRGP